MEMKHTIEKHVVSITISTLVVLIFFIISTTLTVSNWKADVEQKLSLLDKGITHHSNAYNKHEERILNLEGENTEVKVRLATIETKLTSIESLLMEIKEDLKDK